MVKQTCNPSTWVIGAEGLGVPQQPVLQNFVLASKIMSQRKKEREGAGERGKNGNI